MHRSIATITLALGMAASAVSANVVYNDGTFDNANWSIDHVYSGGVAGTPSGTHMLTGGNPGDFRQVGQNSFTRELVTWHMRSGAAYTPAIDGALDSIDFSIDLRAIQNLAGTNVGVSLGIEQGGIYYYQPLTYFISNSIGNWVSRSGTFHAADFGQYPLIASHPDFSSSGAAMRLGIAFSNDNASNLATRVVDVDNWSVTLRPVPSPGFTALIALGGLVTTRRRR